MKTRNEIATEYKITDRGTIGSPGKFEGEMWWAVALWDLVMDGGSDHTGSDDVEWFKIDQETIDAFGLDADKLGHYLAIYEDDSGFVRATIHSRIFDDGNAHDFDADTSEDAQSGYTDCACRDCMDQTVSSDVAQPELCSECKEAGCNPYRGAPRVSHEWECKRPDAYGANDPEGKGV